MTMMDLIGGPMSDQELVPELERLLSQLDLDAGWSAWYAAAAEGQKAMDKLCNHLLAINTRAGDKRLYCYCTKCGKAYECTPIVVDDNNRYVGKE